MDVGDDDALREVVWLPRSRQPRRRLDSPERLRSPAVRGPDVDGWRLFLSREIARREALIRSKPGAPWGLSGYPWQNDITLRDICSP